MASLTSLLPRPKAVLHDPFVSQTRRALGDAGPAQISSIPQSRALVSKEVPPYGHRQGFVPQHDEDFGDGGAFPEVRVLQYPLQMGKQASQGGGQIAQLQVDKDGTVQYDAVIKQGAHAGSNIFTSYKDLMPKDDIDPESLLKPSDDKIAEITEKTRQALEKKISGKIRSARPRTMDTSEKKNEPVYIRYTPGASSAAFNSGAQQRIIRLHEMPVDPMEPPKFKTRKLPADGSEAPVPVLHSPPRKVTVEDQANWKIPPCISNWKNIKGYTIPLDKRLAADGRGLQERTVSDKFANLSEALYIAERGAREEVESRAKMRKTIRTKQKMAREEELRNLAAQARARPGGLASRAADTASEATSQSAADDAARLESEMADDDEDLEEDEDTVEGRDEREQLRHERRRERERDLRMEKRSKKARDKDRDVSEKIALGQQVSRTADSIYDSRLFNRDEGLSSGHAASAETYDVYSKPLFQGSTSQAQYRAGRGGSENTENDVDAMLQKSTKRFKADRGFEGAHGNDASTRSSREEPVQFEKDQADPFGLDEFLGANEKKQDSDRSSRDERRRSRSPRRREESRRSRRSRSRSRSRSRHRDSGRDRDSDRDRRSRRDRR